MALKILQDKLKNVVQTFFARTMKKFCEQDLLAIITA